MVEKTKKSTKTSKSEKPITRRINFVVDAGPGKKVSVAGSFNNWCPTSKILKDKDGSGIYRGCILLPAGNHEYKFVIDDVWCTDDQNPNFVSNDLGTLNSLLIVE